MSQQPFHSLREQSVQLRHDLKNLIFVLRAIECVHNTAIALDINELIARLGRVRAALEDCDGLAQTIGELASIDAVSTGTGAAASYAPGATR